MCICVRFFSMVGNNATNPPSGSVVDDVVTLPERHDFYLVSQSVRQGTVNPTSYNIIENTTSLKAEHFQVTMSGTTWPFLVIMTKIIFQKLLLFLSETDLQALPSLLQLAWNRPCPHGLPVRTQTGVPRRNFHPQVGAQLLFSWIVVVATISLLFDLAQTLDSGKTKTQGKNLWKKLLFIGNLFLDLYVRNGKWKRFFENSRKIRRNNTEVQFFWTRTRGLGRRTLP